jgi:hypothetical protein
MSAVPLTAEQVDQLPMLELLAAANVETVETVGSIKTPALTGITIGPGFFGAATEHRDGRRQFLLPAGLDDTQRDMALRRIIRMVARHQDQLWPTVTDGDVVK